MKNYIYILLVFLFSATIISAQNNISGAIHCEGGAPMANQEVQLDGVLIGDLTTTTDASGNYLFGNLPTGGDYTITVEKTDNPLNGVSTYDLVIIARHILQIELLSSPYLMLQADINGSGSITTFDLVELRKVILAISGNFPLGKSYRFVTEDFNIFPPTGSVDVVNVADLQNDEVVNFTAVKIGDMNESTTCQ